MYIYIFHIVYLVASWLDKYIPDLIEINWNTCLTSCIALHISFVPSKFLWKYTWLPNLPYQLFYGQESYFIPYLFGYVRKFKELQKFTQAPKH